MRGLAIFIYLTAVFVRTYQKLNTSHGEASFDSNLINKIVMFFKDTFPSLKPHGGPDVCTERADILSSSGVWRYSVHGCNHVSPAKL